jgi:predicted transcriptional regulator
MPDPNSTELQNARKNEIKDSSHFARDVQINSGNFSNNITHRRKNRAKYRSRADILCAILKAATEGAAKSAIISYAYVSSPLIKDYMNFLLDNDMLKYNSESRKYHTTEKGHRLLKMYDECKMIFNPK